MKGVIVYYSSTGNTEYACRFLQARVRNVDFDLFSVTSTGSPDLTGYDVAGFAFPTFYFSVPEVLKRFVAGLPKVRDMPVFLLNTYGMMEGKASKIAEGILKRKGYRVIASFALMMPENYPPFISKGWGSREQPDEKQIRGFLDFIDTLSENMKAIGEGIRIVGKPVRTSFFNRLTSERSKEKILKGNGDFLFDSRLCDGCQSRKCVSACPYDAIRVDNGPVVDKSKCWGCWSCFNHCPKRAISTEKVSSDAQYVRPGDSLAEKLPL